MADLIVTQPSNVVPIDPAAWAAREVEQALSDLMREASRAQTVDRALLLYHTCSTLRQELEQVIVKALERADATCGR